MELAPRASDVNTNAYYFVDVVAESLAPVYFVADGGSRLGNPVLIAQAGETNRVPLLIGGRMDVYKQIRHIDENGVFRTDKFGHWISRNPECRIILDGETLQWTHPSH